MTILIEQSDKSSVEEHEFKKGCIAIEKALLTTGNPTPDMLRFEQLEMRFTCAPEEDIAPQYVLLDDNFEVLACPDMFSYGKGHQSIAQQRYHRGNITNIILCSICN